MRFIYLLVLLFLTQPTFAAVYTYTDAEGNRIFTDSPPKGIKANPVTIQPSNSMPSPAAPRTIKLSPSNPDIRKPVQPSAPPPPAQIASYQMLRILVPEPDATIRSNAGELIVTATSDPELMPTHFYRLILDGQPAGAPGRSPVFPLENLDRGTHQIAVEIVTEGGVVVERTPSQPFHMKRMSLSQQRLANPCKDSEWGIRPECPLSEKPEEE
ncbi:MULTISPECIES: DUF4124 domain-containing protein [Pseudomonas]|uniref:DUF4124 domain-containing protein n=1 Tax=Pseudomonas luteola TaxID=47886 RepID=A0ABS0MQE8_PSELU|nr:MULTISPECIES: DUF4124 domain-containing protein [Pseudomonas]MBH3438124.1 DUF4124 domain-containing protein [Pseudomonas luteola]MDN3236978.1 DUF4124 domain-containing protein [Pseudomonas sp. WAC2]